ncbi:Uncharacterised protein [Serratia plymuthica]|nr:Uncharacterised protein [Serratia plymuthica]
MQGSVCGMLYLQQAIALKGTIQGEQAGSGSNGIGYDFLPSNLQTFKPSNLGSGTHVMRSLLPQ